LLGLSLVLPVSEAAARMIGAGQPAVKDSRLSTIKDGATKDLRDLVKQVDQNRQQKSHAR
jgi:hypothetical protein